MTGLGTIPSHNLIKRNAKSYLLLPVSVVSDLSSFPGPNKGYFPRSSLGKPEVSNDKSKALLFLRLQRKHPVMNRFSCLFETQNGNSRPPRMHKCRRSILCCPGVGYEYKVRISVTMQPKYSNMVPRTLHLLHSSVDSVNKIH